MKGQSSIKPQIESKNIVAVRRLYEARGNPDIVKTLLAPDVRWEVVEGFPNSGVYEALNGVGDFFTRLFGDFEDWRTEPAEIFEAGDRVIGLGFYSARVKASGRLFKARFTHVWTMRDPDAVVSLSGFYKFDDCTVVGVNLDNAKTYCQYALNHANLTNGSPLNLVSSNCQPVYAFGSECDPIGPFQLTLLQRQFDALRFPPQGDHQTQVVAGDKHAFDYWYDAISATNPTPVYCAAQQWLAERLKILPTPTPTPTPCN